MTLSILFFLASCGTIFFFGKLLTWIAWKINPQSFNKSFDEKKIGLFFCLF